MGFSTVVKRLILRPSLACFDDFTKVPESVITEAKYI
jgi:hypothetical protein